MQVKKKLLRNLLQWRKKKEENSVLRDCEAKKKKSAANILLPGPDSYPTNLPCRTLLSNAPRCPMFMRPHGMAVTGIDCIHMPGIGRTFTGY